MPILQQLVPNRPAVATASSPMLCLLLALCSGPALASAEPPAAPVGGVIAPRPVEPKTAEQAVKVALAVVGEAKPGGTVRIAATFEIVPGWHIYWENAGESGSATELSLELPAGCSAPLDAAGKPRIDFPVPTVFSKGETTFGYEGRVTLSIPVTLPKEIPAAGLPLKVVSRWLVCKDICLMGRNETTVDLARPVAPESPAAKDLAASLAKLPAPVPAAWKLSVQDTDEDSAVLRIETGEAGGLQFIPFDTPGVLLESGYLADSKDGTMIVPLVLSRESALGRPLEVGGVLRRNDGVAFAFRLPVPAGQ